MAEEKTISLREGIREICDRHVFKRLGETYDISETVCLYDQFEQIQPYVDDPDLELDVFKVLAVTMGVFGSNIVEVTVDGDDFEQTSIAELAHELEQIPQIVKEMSRDDFNRKYREVLKLP